MTSEELELGYDWLYRRLFSLPSIWRRRPSQFAAVLPYLAMSCLYKKSNRIWHFLIKHRLVHLAWRPLVEITRARHLAFRKQLAKQPPHTLRTSQPPPTSTVRNVVPAGL